MCVQMCVDAPRIPSSILFALCHIYHALGFVFCAEFVQCVCDVVEADCLIFRLCCLNNYWLAYSYTTSACVFVFMWPCYIGQGDITCN